MLLDADADVDAKGYEGETALSEVARAGYIEIVRILLEAGATDISSALWQASIMEHPEIVELLEEAIHTTQ